MKKKIIAFVASMCLLITASFACSGDYYACTQEQLNQYYNDLQANCPAGSSIRIYSCSNEPTLIAILSSVAP